eukprot:1245797-Prorocentrum_lima.AAC.1
MVREDVAPWGSGGTAELDKICERSWGCKHSRISIEDFETWRTAPKRGQAVGIPALGGNDRFT